jgi:hypothetical protein
MIDDQICESRSMTREREIRAVAASRGQITVQGFLNQLVTLQHPVAVVIKTSKECEQPHRIG